MSRDHGTQGMPVTNYKADEKEAQRNRKKLMALVKLPGNTVCADCPAKGEAHERLYMPRKNLAARHATRGSCRSIPAGPMRCR